VDSELAHIRAEQLLIMATEVARPARNIDVDGRFVTFFSVSDALTYLNDPPRELVADYEGQVRRGEVAA
jgi:hypothetical protein